jgi:hypothetical protein
MGTLSSVVGSGVENKLPTISARGVTPKLRIAPSSSPETSKM